MTHIPVLLNEIMQFLDPKPGDFIIDGTIDGGGHGAEILKRILPDGELLGIDLDRGILEKARMRIAAAIKGRKMKLANNLLLIHGNYANIPEILSEHDLPKADGLVLDLGFSSEQLEHSGRGFSFSPRTGGEPLLMTYDQEQKPVKDILQELDEKKLAEIIYTLSGERFARRIAKAIKAQGKIKPIETTDELTRVIHDAVPKNYERGRIKPATRTFQALRIYANSELTNLENALEALPNILKKGGRAVVVSFHSLEDRIVKNYFRKLEKEKKLNILTKKPLSASENEIQKNPRSRSAKLRAAIKI